FLTFGLRRVVESGAVSCLGVVVHGENTETHRLSGVQLYAGESRGHGISNEIKVRCIAANNDPETYDGVVAVGQCGLGGKWNFEGPGYGDELMGRPGSFEGGGCPFDETIHDGGMPGSGDDGNAVSGGVNC